MSILFFDLDGTLSVHGDRPTQACLKELARVRSMGHALVLNTGRAPAFVPENIAQLPLWDGKICGGSYVEWRKEILENTPLPEAIVKQVYRWSVQRELQVLFEGVREVFSVGGSYTDASEIFRRDRMPQITKVTFCCDPARVEQKDFPGLRIIHFKQYAEGILLGKSKSTGMERILQATGCLREDAWAFGDSENDRDMLTYAGKSVCMADAPDEFDAFCIYRCQDADGVPEALRKFF